MAYAPVFCGFFAYWRNVISAHGSGRDFSKRHRTPAGISPLSHERAERHTRRDFCFGGNLYRRCGTPLIGHYNAVVACLSRIILAIAIFRMTILAACHVQSVLRGDAQAPQRCSSYGLHSCRAFCRIKTINRCYAPVLRPINGVPIKYTPLIKTRAAL